MLVCLLFFFFQAEDGIRDYKVTGVQTCALPIYAQRYATLFSQKWGGRNRGKIGVMQAGMDVKIVGMDMEKLAFPELDAVSQKRVLVALGVPPILLGQEATYANYAEARQAFYEDTVSPLWDGM